MYVPGKLQWNKTQQTMSAIQPWITQKIATCIIYIPQYIFYNDNENCYFKSCKYILGLGKEFIIKCHFWLNTTF